MSSDKLTVYLPGLPELSSDDIDLYRKMHEKRTDLVEQLKGGGFYIDNVDGEHPWLKDMSQPVRKSDAFLFPPMSPLKKGHPRYQDDVAQRWFEFFSLITGVHVGSWEKFLPGGMSKPCIVMDPDGQWQPAIDLLKDLHNKGMFSSNVEDIVRHIKVAPEDRNNYKKTNRLAVENLRDIIAHKQGKPLKEVKGRYPDDHKFEPFRKDIKRHPFGVLIFGSATTQEKSYTEPVEKLSEMIGKRGWRLVSGAGKDGCMGAMDRGFEKGRKEFGMRFPAAPFKPAHIGVSTQSILRLEGPPDNLDQLIIADDIYDRMRIMIQGRNRSDELERARDAVRVVIVAPGGTGTLHEFATLMQLATNGGIMENRKIILLNPPSHLNAREGFWDPLIKTAKELGFSDKFEVAQTPQKAIDIADLAYKHWIALRPEHQHLPHPTIPPRGGRGIVS